VNVLTQPATMAVEQPDVTIQGLTMTGQFASGADGGASATGSLSADATMLATTSLGPATGTLTAVRIPDALVPPGLPQPTLYFDAGASP
jgi:hypothetical protein